MKIKWTSVYVGDQEKALRFYGARLDHCPAERHLRQSHSDHRAGALTHIPEKACPRLDPGWTSVFQKEHVPNRKSRADTDSFKSGRVE